MHTAERRAARSSARNFALAAAGTCIAACIGAYIYSQQYNISSAIVWAALPAILVELVFYLATGFEWPRGVVEGVGAKPVRAALLWITAIMPYAIASLRLGSFQFSSLALLVALTGVLSFWYVWTRPTAWADIVFLSLAAAVFMSKVLPRIYVAPAKHLPLDMLGKLMWIRLGILAVLTIRGLPMRVGFWPNREEWRIGLIHYVRFLPVGAVLGYIFGFARFHPALMSWWRWPLVLAGTFFAILWVLALAEEFFFRGFLQQMLTRWLHSEVAGLLVASFLFGLAHLPFRAFPNWRFALLAGTAGIFYGRAYIRARGVRASMVSHALVVTTWRLLFPG